MTTERFIDDGFKAIEDQSFTDSLTKKTYYVDYFDEIIDLCNELWEQTQRFEKHNQELEKQLQTSLKIIDWIAQNPHGTENIKFQSRDEFFIFLNKKEVI